MARATLRTGRTLVLEPGVGLRLRDDCENFDCCLCDVIEHPDFIEPEPILGTIEPAETFDATLADLLRLEAQVEFDTFPNRRAKMSAQCSKLLRGARREDDLEPHSGQSIARTVVKQ